MEGEAMDSATAVKAPAEVARAAFDAVARRDAEGVAQYAAPEAVDDFVALGEFKGREAIRAFFVEVFAAFPDFQMSVDRIVADDTVAVAQWHCEGNFTGAPFQGMRPTGRHVALRGVDVIEVADGLIQRNTIYYDGASFARQIGLLPGKDSVGDRALVGLFNLTTSVKELARRQGR
jgi:steroid delta-isomerase-like uncharacterized protein